MVEVVLKRVQALGPHTKRPLLFGLLVALIVTGLLIAAVLTGSVPTGVVGILAGVGMGALVIGDLLQRGDGSRQRGLNHPPRPPGVEAEAKVPHHHPSR